MPAAGAVWPEVSGSPHKPGKYALGPEVTRRGLPPPARLFLCNAVVMLGESWKRTRGGTVELVGSPGGGDRPAAPTLVTVPAANSKSGHSGRKQLFFPLSALLFLGFVLFYFIFKPMIFFLTSK